MLIEKIFLKLTFIRTVGSIRCTFAVVWEVISRVSASSDLCDALPKHAVDVNNGASAYTPILDSLSNK